MARYIDADFVTANINRVLEEKKTEKETTAYFAFEQFKFLLGQAPTADVEEVKHGHWENDLYCSVCGYLYDTGEYHNSHNYCPACGAKMDGEKDLKEREKE